MPMSLLLDCFVVALVLIFVASGMRLGFVRSLCSFLALFIALFGAIYLSKTLTPVTTQAVAPYVLPAIEKKLQGVPSAPTDSDFSHVNVETLLQTLPQNWKQMIEQLDASQSSGFGTNQTQNPMQWLSFQVLTIVTSAVLFIVSFVLILLLWSILSKSLDLVARLPVLNFFNRILGAAFGLLKAVLFLFLLRWLLCDLWGVLPQDLLNQSYAYHYISTVFNALPLDRFFLL